MQAWSPFFLTATVAPACLPTRCLHFFIADLKDIAASMSDGVCIGETLLARTML